MTSPCLRCFVVVPAAPLQEPNRGGTAANEPPPRAATATARYCGDLAAPARLLLPPPETEDRLRTDSVPTPASSLYCADDVPLRFLLSRHDPNNSVLWSPPPMGDGSQQKSSLRQRLRPAAAAVVPQGTSSRRTSRRTTVVKPMRRVDSSAAASTVTPASSCPACGCLPRSSVQQTHLPPHSDASSRPQRQLLRGQPSGRTTQQPRQAQKTTSAEVRVKDMDGEIRPWTPSSGNDDGSCTEVTEVANATTRLAHPPCKLRSSGEGSCDDDVLRAAYAMSMCIDLLCSERVEALMRRYFSAWRRFLALPDRWGSRQAPCALQIPPFVHREDIVRSFSPSPEAVTVVVPPVGDSCDTQPYQSHLCSGPVAKSRSKSAVHYYAVAEATSDGLASCVSRFLMLRYWMKWYRWARRAASPRRCAPQPDRHRSLDVEGDAEVRPDDTNGRQCPVDALLFVDATTRHSSVPCLDPHSPSGRSLVSLYSEQQQSFHASDVGVALPPYGLATCSSGGSLTAAEWGSLGCPSGDGGPPVPPSEVPVHIECFHINL